MRSEIPENRSEVRFMSSLAEATYRIKELAEPAPVGDNWKAAVRRVAAKLDRFCKATQRELWSHNRIKDMYFADKRICVSADEIDTLRAIEEWQRREAKDAQREVREILAGLACLADRLARIDPDFHREALSAFGEVARGTGAQVGGSRDTDRAVDKAGLNQPPMED